jgi:hypothetical protein
MEQNLSYSTQKTKYRRQSLGNQQNPRLRQQPGQTKASKHTATREAGRNKVAKIRKAAVRELPGSRYKALLTFMFEEGLV